MDTKVKSVGKRTVIAFVAPASLAQKIKAKAEQELISASDVIRRAVIRELERA